MAWPSCLGEEMGIQVPPIVWDLSARAGPVTPRLKLLVLCPGAFYPGRVRTGARRLHVGHSEKVQPAKLCRLQGTCSGPAELVDGHVPPSLGSC